MGKSLVFCFLAHGVGIAWYALVCSVYILVCHEYDLLQQI